MARDKIESKGSLVKKLVFGISLIFLADQLTKFLVVEQVFGFSFWRPDLFTTMQGVPLLPITPFFDLALLGNKGVSFSLFPADSWTQAMVFVVISLLISAILIYWTLKQKDKFVLFCTSLIVGGALGNALDRVRFGAVVDFLHFHLGGLSWPVFNIADTTICLGVVFWIVYSIKGQKSEVRDQKT